MPGCVEDVRFDLTDAKRSFGDVCGELSAGDVGIGWMQHRRYTQSDRHFVCRLVMIPVAVRREDRRHVGGSGKGKNRFLIVGGVNYQTCAR